MISNEDRAAIQKLRDSMTFEARLDAAVELLRCDIGEDNYGQILLYTGLTYGPQQRVVVLTLDDDDDDD